MSRGLCRELDVSVDIEALRVRLAMMSDDELLRFGLQMRGLVNPLTYGPNGKPSVSAFSIQLDEARTEWRRRKAERNTIT
jgi:hypothetical protein